MAGKPDCSGCVREFLSKVRVLPSRYRGDVGRFRYAHAAGADQASTICVPVGCGWDSTVLSGKHSCAGPSNIGILPYNTRRVRTAPTLPYPLGVRLGNKRSLPVKASRPRSRFEGKAGESQNQRLCATRCNLTVLSTGEFESDPGARPRPPRYPLSFASVKY